jgi:hypothetical protein
MNLRSRIGQGAMSLASLTGIRPQARTPAPAAERDEGPTAEEIAAREATDAALRVATLNGVAAAAEADPPGEEDGEMEQDQEPDPMDDLRRRVEDLESRMPAEDCEADAAAEAAANAAWVARLNAIFASPAAQGQANLAVMLTFGTDKDAETVIAELRAAAKAATGLDARMANAPGAALPPAQPTATPKEAVTASWDNAFAAIRRR